MAVGGSRRGTLDPGFVLLSNRQQGIPVILRKLVLPDGFDPKPLKSMHVKKLLKPLERSERSIKLYEHEKKRAFCCDVTVIVGLVRPLAFGC
ncbi:unnamed protein product [Schistosoma margrebowiei]|uniref:Uncharacterized protein n=1 Tax=Schistosoma margrebowiei TaxID=48269 RepID=A0A183N8E1_9TREM|nr:unnamed protein product [Schistosoma margrebowiei]